MFGRKQGRSIFYCTHLKIIDVTTGRSFKHMMVKHNHLAYSTVSKYIVRYHYTQTVDGARSALISGKKKDVCLMLLFLVGRKVYYLNGDREYYYVPSEYYINLHSHFTNYRVIATTSTSTTITTSNLITTSLKFTSTSLTILITTTTTTTTTTSTTTTATLSSPTPKYSIFINNTLPTINSSIFIINFLNSTLYNLSSPNILKHTTSIIPEKNVPIVVNNLDVNKLSKPTIRISSSTSSLTTTTTTLETRTISNLEKKLSYTPNKYYSTIFHYSNIPVIEKQNIPNEVILKTNAPYLENFPLIEIKYSTELTEDDIVLERFGFFQLNYGIKRSILLKELTKAAKISFQISFPKLIITNVNVKLYQNNLFNQNDYSFTVITQFSNNNLKKKEYITGKVVGTAFREALVSNNVLQKIDMNFKLVLPLKKFGWQETQIIVTKTSIIHSISSMELKYFLFYILAFILLLLASLRLRS
ncbi:hypothetical protein SNEBB_004676 [Seison nebaliae]|nr:hypothetical protein SNEBB_004676 [Seison nebaliae]